MAEQVQKEEVPRTINFSQECAHCNESSSHWCAGCKKVTYCSIEHQQEDRKKHKKLCYPATVCTDDKQGRFMVATRNISAGEFIFKDKPIVIGPNPNLPDRSMPLCLGCYKQVEAPAGLDTYACSTCKWPMCNEECEKISQHADYECKILAAGNCPPLIEQYGYKCINILRCLLLQYISPQKWEEVTNLQSHGGSYLKGTVKGWAHFVTQFFAAHIRLNGEEFSEGDILQVLKIFETHSNTFVDYSEDGRVLRACLLLLPKVSLLNHDCVPTAAWYRVNLTSPISNAITGSVYAIQSIKKGQSITINYVSTLRDTQTRQTILNRDFHFKCCCKRCIDPTEFGTYYSGMKCMSTKCSKGFVLPMIHEQIHKCNKCQETLDWDWKNMDQFKPFIDSYGKLLEGMTISQATVDQMETFMHVQERIFLHPHHQIIVSMKSSMLEVLWQLPANERVLLKQIEIAEFILKLIKVLAPGTDEVVNLLTRLCRAKCSLFKRKALQMYSEEDTDKMEMMMEEKLALYEEILVVGEKTHRALLLQPDKTSQIMTPAELRTELELIGRLYASNISYHEEVVKLADSMLEMEMVHESEPESISESETVSESATVSESTTASECATTSESATVSDSGIESMAVGEATTVCESAAASQSKIVSDSGNESMAVGEAISVRESSALSESATVSASKTVSDSVSESMAVDKDTTVSESTTVSDSVNESMAVDKDTTVGESAAVSESTTVSDSVNESTTIGDGTTVGESAAVSDSVNESVVVREAKTVSDSVNGSVAVRESTTVNDSVNESAVAHEAKTVSDSVNEYAAIRESTTVGESATVNDSVNESAVVHEAKTVSDSVNESAVVHEAKTVSDSVDESVVVHTAKTVSDSVDESVVVHTAKTVSDSVNESAAVHEAKTVSDSVDESVVVHTAKTVSDSVNESAAVHEAKTVSDSVNESVVVHTAKTVSDSVNESVAVRESTTVGKSAAVSESTTISESTTVNDTVKEPMAATVRDSTTVGESKPGDESTPVTESMTVGKCTTGIVGESITRGGTTIVSASKATGGSATVSASKATGGSATVSASKAAGVSTPTSASKAAGVSTPTSASKAAGVSTPTSSSKAAGGSTPISTSKGTGGSTPIRRTSGGSTPSSVSKTAGGFSASKAAGGSSTHIRASKAARGSTPSRASKAASGSTGVGESTTVSKSATVGGKRKSAGQSTSDNDATKTSKNNQTN